MYLNRGRTLNGGLAQLGERLPCKQEVTGSIPVLSTTRQDNPERGVSSAGRAPALQAGGHRFEPGTLHHQAGPGAKALRTWSCNRDVRPVTERQEVKDGPIAQLARAHD